MAHLDTASHNSGMTRTGTRRCYEVLRSTRSASKARLTCKFSSPLHGEVGVRDPQRPPIELQVKGSLRVGITLVVFGRSQGITLCHRRHGEPSVVPSCSVPAKEQNHPRGTHGSSRGPEQRLSSR